MKKLKLLPEPTILIFIFVAIIAALLSTSPESMFGSVNEKVINIGLFIGAAVICIVVLTGGKKLSFRKFFLVTMIATFSVSGAWRNIYQYVFPESKPKMKVMKTVSVVDVSSRFYISKDY